MSQLFKILFLSLFILNSIVASAAITAVTSTANVGGSTAAANFTLTSPSGTTTNDVLVVNVSQKSGSDLVTAIDDGSGHAFTKITSSTINTNNTISIWYRKVGASDGTTWTVTNTSNCEGAIMAYRGVNTTTQIDANGSANTYSSGTTATFAAVTTVTNNAWYIATGGMQSALDNEWSASSGSPAITERADKSNGGSSTKKANVIIADREITTATTTDAPVDNTVSTIFGNTYTFALRPVTTSAAVTGTITPSVTESDIVAGGKTLIITLTGDTWIAAGAASFDLQRDEIIAGVDSAQSETFGWDLVPKVTQSLGGVVRTSDTVVTITWDAFATYDITATETITVTVPGTAVVLGGAIVATPTFTVTAAGGTKKLAALGVG